MSAEKCNSDTFRPLAIFPVQSHNNCTAFEQVHTHFIVNIIMSEDLFFLTLMC